MRSILFLPLLAILLVACHPSPQSSLPRAAAPSPCAASFDSVFLAVNSVSANSLHSLLIAHHDTIIYEKYAPGFDADRLHICWSATKTFTATAIGMAVQDSLLDLHTPIINYIPREELPDTVSPEFHLLTLDHLLKMSSGLPASDFTDRIRAGQQVNTLHEAASATFCHEPGTTWSYNNMDTYLAGYVLSKVSGMSLEDYIRIHIFEPLGITDWFYETDSEGINPAAWGLHLSAESLMRMGLFMAHKGEWQGKQLLNPEWFDLACTKQMQQYKSPDAPTHDWNVGYGYQVWMCQQPNVYRIDGMWGQYVIIAPDKDLVCVMNTLSTDRYVQLDAYWQYIYSRL